MEIDGSYLIIAGEIGIGIFIVMSSDRIWDFVYPKVVFIIFSGLIPFMIWGFFAQTAAYKKDSLEPSSYERFVAEDKAWLAEALEREKLEELQPLKKREEPPPPQKYNPEDNNFSIPLQQLLEGNHGRFL